MIKLRSKRFSKRSSKVGGGGGGGGACYNSGDIKWEMRPGGMLVQKRENSSSEGDGVISLRVSTVSHCHHISIEATSTFGELKMILSIVTGLDPREQRLLYRGKEREDGDHLHMAGVKESDKVLLLEDPAYTERKLLGLITRNQPSPPTITV